MLRVIHHSNLCRLFLLSLILDTKRKYNHANAINLDVVKVSRLPRILSNSQFILSWQNLFHHHRRRHDSSKRSLRKRKRSSENNNNNNKNGIFNEQVYQNNLIQDFQSRYMVRCSSSFKANENSYLCTSDLSLYYTFLPLKIVHKMF